MIGGGFTLPDLVLDQLSGCGLDVDRVPLEIGFDHEQGLHVCVENVGRGERGDIPGLRHGPLTIQQHGKIDRRLLEEAVEPLIDVGDGYPDDRCVGCGTVEKAGQGGQFFAARCTPRREEMDEDRAALKGRERNGRPVQTRQGKIRLCRFVDAPQFSRARVRRESQHQECRQNRDSEREPYISKLRAPKLGSRWIGHAIIWGSTRAGVNAIRRVCRGVSAQLMKSSDRRTAATTCYDAIPISLNVAARQTFFHARHLYTLTLTISEHYVINA